MELAKLQKLCHKNAVEKGFWGQNGKDKRNVSELLMLIVSELGEACEALRKGNRQPSASLSGKKLDCGWMKDSFEDEIADSIIRICDLAEAENIDLEWQIKKKLEYNKTRPHMHGKKF